jgi:saccharopine dehydrogenase-like NADP-dependent oxidoreductase
MCDLLVEGKLPQKGFVRQEDATLQDFIGNRFGRYYGKGH